MQVRYAYCIFNPVRYIPDMTPVRLRRVVPTVLTDGGSPWGQGGIRGACGRQVQVVLARGCPRALDALVVRLARGEAFAVGYAGRC